MINKKIKLVKPNLNYRDSYYDFVNEVIANNETSELGNVYRENENFNDMLVRLEKRSKGIDIHHLEVPATIYFIIDEQNSVVGSIDLRHYLNESYFKRNGNIAYIIKPSERNKGYATLALKEAIEIYKKHDVEKILVTCFKNNVASQKVIKNNNGILKKEVKDSLSDNIIQRWWIYLK